MRLTQSDPRTEPTRSFLSQFRPAIVLTAALTLLASAPARAAFPGARGRIAFTVRNYERGLETSRIFLVRKDGSKQHPLRHEAAGHSPAWAPGGKRLAFVRCAEVGSNTFDSGNCDLWMSRVDGTNQRQLTDTSGVYEGQPAWSADGRSLVYSACDAHDSVLMDVSCDLEILDRASKAVRTLTDNALLEGGVAWSPNGKWIAFHRYRCGSCSVTPGDRYPEAGGKVWLIRPDGTGLHKLTGAGGRGAWEPNWSPSGRKIVVHAGSQRGARVPYAHFRVYTRTGRFLSVVGNDDYFRFSYDDFQSPVWAPKGRAVAFRVYAGDDGGVGIWNLVTDKPTYPYMDYNLEGYEPDWQPRQRGG